MAEPSEARIAAALALAEADDAWFGETDGPPDSGWDRESKDHYLRLQSYRATAPKLRTRAEVDAEIAKVSREFWSNPHLDLDRRERLENLCAEPTAEAEPNRVTDHDADQRPEDPNHTGVIQPPAYGPSSVDSSAPPSAEPAAGATSSEPEACGCEQSDDLKDKLTECRRLLRAIHGFAKSITELSREIP